MQLHRKKLSILLLLRPTDIAQAGACRRAVEHFGAGHKMHTVACQENSAIVLAIVIDKHARIPWPRGLCVSSRLVSQVAVCICRFSPIFRRSHSSGERLYHSDVGENSARSDRNAKEPQLTIVTSDCFEFRLQPLVASRPYPSRADHPRPATR